MKWIVTGTYRIEVDADDEDEAVENGQWEFKVDIRADDMEWAAKPVEDDQRERP